MRNRWLLALCCILLVWGAGMDAWSERGPGGIMNRQSHVTTTINPNTLYSASYALVIGASAYQSGWPKLRGVLDDVTAVQTTLEQQGFQVTTVLDPDRAALLKAFDDFINTYGRNTDNRLLFYFAGHGYTDKTYWGEVMGYIVPVNAPNPLQDLNGFLNVGVNMQQIEVYAKNIRSKHALFIFDSCFSGTIFALSRKAIPPAITYKTALPVRQFITSGSADETVPDSSLFRQQFISALTGKADTNGDGYITGTELGMFLEDKVINYSRDTQHPQFGTIRAPGLDEGDFVFQVAETASPTYSPIAIQPVLIADNSNFRLDATQHRQVAINDEPERKPFEPEMVAIPTGEFKMGSPSNEEGRSDNEGLVHTVHVQAFQMGKYEVTNAQFRNFRPDHNSGEYKGHSLNGNEQPVVKVSWADAVAYTEWLAKETGKPYRLPTEAEWEYAARAGTNTSYYWGTAIDPTKLNFSDKNDPSGPARDDLDDGYAVSAPVGSYPANPWGLYDMLGNVWEWNQDRWHDNYDGAPTDGSAWESGDGLDRLLRGCSWVSKPDICHLANRLVSMDPLNHFGFRVVIGVVKRGL